MPKMSNHEMLTGWNESKLCSKTKKSQRNWDGIRDQEDISQYMQAIKGERQRKLVKSLLFTGNMYFLGKWVRLVHRLRKRDESMTVCNSLEMTANKFP
jgi:hypothetical protein